MPARCEPALFEARDAEADVQRGILGAELRPGFRRQLPKPVRRAIPTSARGLSGSDRQTGM
eukprot:7294643-Alexandrium_andersonii.AAC.1